MKINTIHTTPYATLQDSVNTTESRLLDYYRNSVNELNYEYKNGSTYALIFITGKNEEEKAMGRFYMPIYFTTSTNKLLIFVDLRSCVNAEKDKNFTTIDSIVKDKSLLEIKINHVGLICHYLKESTFDEEFTINTIKIFASVITNTIASNLRLDVLDANELKYVLAYYYASIVFPDKEHDSKIIITAKAVGSIAKIDEVDNLIKQPEKEIVDINDLVTLFSTCLTSRVNRLNRTLILTIISSILFGNEVKHYVAVAMENAFIFMSLVYSGYNNRLFKKTPMAMVLNTQGRFLDVKEYAKRIELFVKDIK